MIDVKMFLKSLLETDAKVQIQGESMTLLYGGTMSIIDRHIRSVTKGTYPPSESLEIYVDTVLYLNMYEEDSEKELLGVQRMRLIEDLRHLILTILLEAKDNRKLLKTYHSILHMLHLVGTKDLSYYSILNEWLNINSTLGDDEEMCWVEHLCHRMSCTETGDGGPARDRERIRGFVVREDVLGLILLGEYDEMVCRSHGWIRLVLLFSCPHEQDRLFIETFESVDRSLYFLSWRLCLRYLSYTQKASIYFSYVSRHVSLDVSGSVLMAEDGVLNLSPILCRDERHEPEDKEDTGDGGCATEEGREEEEGGDF